MLTTDYRPHTFRDMVGQDRTTALLRTVLSSDSIPSTFLFTGAYGSGKTTAARIVAAMVNCPNSADQKDACGTCESCVEIAEGRSDALVEIDSAVYSGVDNIRTLTDLVEYGTPHAYRVVVLDECHALSGQAFNALLKVMEEAPQNTIFVLVTTHPHKVPQTVQSRSVRLYFGPIPTSTIESRLTAVCEAEGIEAEPKALHLIATLSGSLRDALVNLQVCGTDIDQIVHYLGDPSQVKKLFRKVLRGEDWSEDFDAMVATLDPTTVVEALVDVLAGFHIQGAIPKTVYQNTLDIVWGLAEVTTFDTRGIALTNLCFRRLAATLIS